MIQNSRSLSLSASCISRTNRYRRRRHGLEFTDASSLHTSSRPACTARSSRCWARRYSTNQLLGDGPRFAGMGRRRRPWSRHRGRLAQGHGARGGEERKGRAEMVVAGKEMPFPVVVLGLGRGGRQVATPSPASPAYSYG